MDTSHAAPHMSAVTFCMPVVVRNLLLIAVLAIVGVGISACTPSSGTASSPVGLRTVSTKSLATAGIVLDAPTSVARASKEEAIDTTLKNYPFGAKILETVLAQVHTIPPGQPRYNKTCWVISVHPIGGVSGANGEHGKWELALVSAKTGHWLFTTIWG